MSDPKPVTVAEVMLWSTATKAVNQPDAYVAFDRLLATAQAAAEVATPKAQWLNLSAKLQETIARAVAAEASLTEALDLLADRGCQDSDLRPACGICPTCSFLVRHGRKP